MNGVSVLQIPARDAYAYGRSLLEVIFSKEELSKSVIFKTKKSNKPPLRSEGVQLMFGKLVWLRYQAESYILIYVLSDCIDRRYKEKYEYSKMLVTLGQKCRDCGRESRN